MRALRAHARPERGRTARKKKKEKTAATRREKRWEKLRAFNFYARSTLFRAAAAHADAFPPPLCREETRRNREIKTTKCTSFPTTEIYARNTRASLDSSAVPLAFNAGPPSYASRGWKKLYAVRFVVSRTRETRNRVFFFRAIKIGQVVKTVGSFGTRTDRNVCESSFENETNRSVTKLEDARKREKFKVSKYHRESSFVNERS